MPIFRSDEVPGKAHDAKAPRNPDSGGTHGALPDAQRRGGPKPSRRRTPEQRIRLKSKRQELRQKKRELRQIRQEAPPATSLAGRIEHRRKKESIQLEIFRLERELRASKEGTVAEPVTGALPDFVVIGAQKGGTSYFYHLLTQHPFVEPAAKKELHFFDHLFDLGVEWYRGRFPQPAWKHGRRTITGEATPYYLFHPHAAKRMAEVIPGARLIALLRNPVDRAYSHYQMAARNGSETLSFEEALEAEEARLHDEKDKMLEDERYDSSEHRRFSYLSRGVYVDQLLRWTEYFDREQLLVLKSEDLFERPQETLALTLDFLGLPGWEPVVLESLSERDKEGNYLVKSNRGRYEKWMDPALRHRLEEYFEPHNKRLYDFLGADFGW